MEANIKLGRIFGIQIVLHYSWLIIALLVAFSLGGEPRKRAFTTVDDAMRPLEQLRIIAPDAPVIEALELMGREDVNQLPVVRDGQLEGIISRAHILQLLQTRAELNM